MLFQYLGFLQLFTPYLYFLDKNHKFLFNYCYYYLFSYYCYYLIDQSDSLLNYWISQILQKELLSQVLFFSFGHQIVLQVIHLQNLNINQIYLKEYFFQLRGIYNSLVNLLNSKVVKIQSFIVIKAYLNYENFANSRYIFQNQQVSNPSLTCQYIKLHYLHLSLNVEHFKLLLQMKDDLNCLYQILTMFYLNNLLLLCHSSCLLLSWVLSGEFMKERNHLRVTQTSFCCQILESFITSFYLHYLKIFQN
ncbi:transmembrane protein, putative (macronuclear) [Tetrahymena thermophila SB210]|uniref:Transmembrane protein, putative n=1 Tax=Tetrahymena thermophila (strain SB210) TaxID=312017 RepID=W7XH86_TETTS|nr:transmembrane protein, putative [Tetrahymena thermophila SB210]EWS72399.1 transmembrane protein, putative [Tetrahymena thermophila SB210]|eukprot:XP_012655083.1 transmembrane protein, putative [Tetrahymena thermophila SB210]